MEKERKLYVGRFTEAEILETLAKFGRGERCETIVIENPDNRSQEPPDTVTPEELKEFEESFQAWGKTRQKFT